MRLVRNTCEGCEERHEKCHASCEKYIKAKQETDEAKKKERLFKEHEGYVAEAARRIKRERRGK